MLKLCVGNYRPQTKFAKVMYPGDRGGVSAFRRGRVCIRGSVCIQTEGSASRGIAQTPPIGYYGIWSTRGWYASYWNAFLLENILCCPTQCSVFLFLLLSIVLWFLHYCDGLWIVTVRTSNSSKCWHSLIFVLKITVSKERPWTTVERILRGAKFSKNKCVNIRLQALFIGHVR